MRVSPTISAIALRTTRRRLPTKLSRLANRLVGNPKRGLQVASLASTSQKVTLPHLPELYKADFLDILIPSIARGPVTTPKDAPPSPENSMISALNAKGNEVRTQNNAPAFRSTGNALVDAFLRPTVYHQTASIDDLLRPAWEEDPETTLRIIFYFRSIHDGKNDRKLFYRAWAWLYEKHPRTAIHNLQKLIDPSCERELRKGDERQLPGRSHGYWKDLLNILCLAATNKLGKQDHYNFGSGTKPRHFRGMRSRAYRSNERRESLNKSLAEDPKFRALYVAVARLFAGQLVADAGLLTQYQNTTDPETLSKLQWQISLAGKWAPTPGLSHDRITNISTAIAQLLHSTRESQSWIYPSSLSDFDHTRPLSVEQATTLRSYLQRWFLTPLRAHSKCPEPLMSAKKWGDINYSRVPSLSMSLNAPKFLKHDYERFSRHLFDVSVGKKSISGATLLPHEILMRLVDYETNLGFLDIEKAESNDGVDRYKKKFLEAQIMVASAQWNTLVERLRDSGGIENSIAICDVSGSMGTLNDYKNRKDPQPIFPALAMTILLSILGKPPFNGGFITFSQEPEYVKLNDLAQLTTNMKMMLETSWGMNTDLQKVFTELLLPLAKQHKVKKEDMIKRLFIFSDMQFDEGTAEKYEKNKSWETTHDIIKKEYEAAGYDVPEIVYWDLGNQDTVEIHANREGVALMKGFSAGMMKVFLGEQETEGDSPAAEGAKVEKEAMTPAGVMRQAVMNKSFDGLVVLD
ncbi:hypothetical protein TWF730_011262 [Orbilia blumenaviensis]|uniref:Uncharacterized protein n=1 Tax=Orbilia blumenaviensis TaxID=1796055 RepID=A0AAV9UN96_9PEZI